MGADLYHRKNKRELALKSGQQILGFTPRGRFKMWLARKDAKAGNRARTAYWNIAAILRHPYLIPKELKATGVEPVTGLRDIPTKQEVKREEDRREAALANYRSFYQRNKKTMLAKQKEYNTANPEKRAATQAKYRAKKREELNRKQRETYHRRKEASQQ